MPHGGNARNRRYLRRHPGWEKPKLWAPSYTRWQRFKAWITRSPLDYSPRRRSS